VKKKFIFILLLLSSFLWAQNPDRPANHSCLEQVPTLYNWSEIETEFSKDLNITISQTKTFFKYAAKWDYFKMKEYVALVKEGSITKANAQQYWRNKLPYLENLYSYKYLPALAQEKAEAEKRQTELKTGIGNRAMSSCNNLDFSSGDLSNWTGKWNDAGSALNITDPNTGQVYGYGALTVNGLNSNGSYNSMGYVHELCNGGTDRNVPINTVAPGHSYSLRLGDDSAYVERNAGQSSNNVFPYNHQTISNTFLVTAANKSITYWYAVVLDQNATSGHPPAEQPYFTIRMYDAAGNAIPCAPYDVNVTDAASVGGFQEINDPSGSYLFYYKNWTPILIPLINYVGQNVTITFETSDCDRGGHFGYAYVTVDCNPFTSITYTPFPCGATTTTLTAPAGVATYTWSGPGITSSANSQTVTVNAGGSYTVTMSTISNNGTNCVFSVDTTIAGPTAQPTASFSATAGCIGITTQFTDISNNGGGVITSWHWNFGDGGTSTSNNPTHTYTASGSYPVTYTIATAAGCSSTYSTTVQVHPSPTSSFTAAPVCKGAPTSFVNSSTGGNVYHWNFGDGSVSQLQSPSYTYANSGVFAVTLSVTNTFSCTAVSNNSATVNPYPTVVFSSPQTCLGSNTVFSNTSTPATGVSYSWNFGDQTNSADTSSNQNPVYTYPTVGTYSVTLTVTSSAGCASSKTNTTSVNPIPYVTASPGSTYCWNDIVISPVLVNTPTGSNPTYAWTNSNTQIGLNSSGTGTPPIFTAALNNTGSDITGVISITPHLNGCTGPPATYTVVVKPTPVVTHASLNYCPSDTVPAITLTASPAAASANITWSTTTTPFIGLSATNGTTTIPEFNAISNVTSSVSNVFVLNDNLNGCAGPISTFSITINANPTAGFTYTDACDGNNTNFIDHSVANSGVITQWLWNFGTGTSTSQAPNYLLTPAGTYTVNLQVINNKGCKHDTTEQVVVNPSPVVSFGAVQAGCSPFTTTFIDTVSTTPPVSIWNWNFGNTATATYTTNTFTSLSYTNASHTQSIFYNVSLSVTSDKNCVTTLTKNNYIQVYPKPLADFTWNPKNTDILDPSIYFSNQSIGASGPTAYNWNFGDIYETVDSLNFSALANPKHVYSDQIPSEYTVSLVVQNTFGCKDSTAEVVVINDAVTFYIPNAFSPNGDLKNEGFKGTGIGIDNNTYNLWIFDRWGLLIFHATDLETAWDGHLHGSPVQEDVYVWKVTFEDKLARFHEYHGTVTLMR
jgi:gliding motility-associated-like protein